MKIFAGHARRYLSMADIRITDHWAKAGGSLPRSAFERFGLFADMTRQLGLTHLAREPWELEALPGGRPIIFQHASLNYYGGSPESVAQEVRKTAGNGPGPRFVLMYTGPRPIQYYRDIVEALGDERYVPVTLDVMMELATKHLASE
jgi:hypothetical protein